MIPQIYVVTRAGRNSKTILSHHIASTQQLPYKADNIRLEVCIWTSVEKLSDTAWTNEIRFRKVTIQDFKGFFIVMLMHNWWVYIVEKKGNILRGHYHRSGELHAATRCDEDA